MRNICLLIMILLTQWPLYTIYKKEQELEKRVAELEEANKPFVIKVDYEKMFKNQFADADKKVDELEGDAESEVKEND